MPKKFKILIVDDSKTSQSQVRGYLGGNFIIESAYDGNTALNAVRTFIPHLVLLDIVMPDISGIEVCRKIQLDPDIADIPVIMLTSKTGENDVREALEAGAVDYIKKPFSKIELLARIKSSLRLRTYIINLKGALSDVKKLSGLLPICANCKKIRDDKGYWQAVDVFIEDHSSAEFTHGLCPECDSKLYSKYDKK